jgi:nucleoside-diphosphate-sugar epimerase
LPNVLITGGLGFIGGAAAYNYALAGWRVDVCDDLTNNTYAPHSLGTEAEWYCDVAEALNRIRLSLREYDLVIHCASPVGAAGVLPWRGRLAYEIMRTTHAVTCYCNAFGVPLINVSSSEVYGFSGTYHEKDALRVPAHVNTRIEYAVGKMAAETAVRLLPGLNSISLRPFNVVGSDQRSAGGFVLPTFAEQAVEGRPLTVYGDGTQQRAFLAVEDLVSFMLLLQRDDYDGRVVNLGNPTNRITILNLAHLVSETARTKFEIVYTDGKAVHGEDYAEAEGYVKLPDIALAEDMGWSPRYTLNEIALAAVEKIACR